MGGPLSSAVCLDLGVKLVLPVSFVTATAVLFVASALACLSLMSSLAVAKNEVRGCNVERQCLLVVGTDGAMTRFDQVFALLE